MVMMLSKWLSFNRHLPAWGIMVIAIVLWTLILWGVGNFMRNHKVRPARVVIQAQRILWLAGALFIFNVSLVPVVLLAFHGMAMFALWVCALAAILYFVKVDDKERSRFDTNDPF